MYNMSIHFMQSRHVLTDICIYIHIIYVLFSIVINSLAGQHIDELPTIL